ncbi:hypothetical protein [Bacillus sp. Hm123]|uniref:hypothetical protein n=1 Tax=Bacillus sp. Hm123 TaxID=3450745 RepID=UPI003F43F03F
MLDRMIISIAILIFVVNLLLPMFGMEALGERATLTGMVLIGVAMIRLHDKINDKES